MIHPSYTELLKVINSSSEENDAPVVNSRYSVVMAAAKRARQIIAGDAMVTEKQAKKPLSTAVAELYSGEVRILPEESIAQELPVSEAPALPDDGGREQALEAAQAPEEENGNGCEEDAGADPEE